LVANGHDVGGTNLEKKRMNQPGFENLGLAVQRHIISIHTELILKMVSLFAFK
jgi:hypothetical protein